MTLELRQVTKQVGSQTHIKPTTLVFETGHFNVLLGQTGAGKTSLIKLMAGLDKISGGTLLMDGQDVTGQSTQKRNISLVHQFFVNYPHMTVFDNIAAPLRVAGVARSEIAGRVEAAADILRLRPMLKRRPHELSGGQQQRTALARAIVKDSRAVFLDEPLANLDYKLREELREQLPELFAGRGAVVIYATSEPEEALLLGGNTATLWEGRVTQFGPTPSVYRMPADATTARVFSDPPMNFVPCRKEGARLTFAGENHAPAEGSFKAIPDGAYLAGFRANHVTLNRHSGDAVEFRCTLSVTEITGSETFVHLTHGSDRWVGLVHGVHQMEPGSALSIWLDPAHVYLFDPEGRLAAPAPYAMAA